MEFFQRIVCSLGGGGGRLIQTCITTPPFPIPHIFVARCLQIVFEFAYFRKIKRTRLECQNIFKGFPVNFF